MVWFDIRDIETETEGESEREDGYIFERKEMREDNTL
jgi:hypothetical protein